MTDVLADRAHYEAEIAGRTLPEFFAETAAAFADEPAYSDKNQVPEGQAWRTLTWAQAREQVLDVAAGLIDLGVAQGDRIAIMATNRNEHLLADLAAGHAAATPMSIYNTLSQEQVAYIAGESTPKVAIVEDHDHLQRWELALAAADGPAYVVLLEGDLPEGDARFLTWDDVVARGRAARAADADVVTRRTASLRADDPATILYTSGTTGPPKGVVLSHTAVVYEAVSTKDASGLDGPQRSISYLPLAHIAERVLALYIPQFIGGHVHNIGDPAALLATLGEVHPTSFFGVPRVWEKIKTGISAKLAEDPDPANQKLVADAMAAGLAWVSAQEYGGQMTPEIEAAYAQADAAILGFLRALLGLDQAQWTASAAAPMPLEVARFMAGLGLKVYDVYGMTETTGSATSNGPTGFKLGTVGRANPGIEVRLGHDGEVLMRGPILATTYFNNPEATAALIDEDGWLHSGDIGTIDDDGFISIVDRKKELIITTAGKNIAPSNIENYLKESPIIGHAMAIGDARPYVVAILTLDGEIAPIVAQKMGIAFTDLADLAQKPEILAMAQAAVDAANARLSRPEQIKSFELLPVEWTAESDELTPTLKLKRRVVNTKYADVVDRLYV